MRLAVLFFILATCASGCRILDQRKENEAHFAPAVVPEPSTVNVTPELDSARTGFRKLNDGENERRPFPLLVSDPTAPQVPGHLCAEKGHDQQFDSWLIPPALRNEWAASAGNRQQPIAADLWNVPTTHSSLIENGWLGNKKVSVGISQTPNNSVYASVKVAHGEDRAWLFGWNYSGAAKQPYLVPRIQHIWQISDKIRLNAGVIFPNLVDPTFDLSLTIRR